MLSIHANTGGGLSVIIARTLHTYINVLKQLADSFKLSVSNQALEKQLIETAFNHAKERKTLYILIDEAHLLDIIVLRKLRLLFDRFPRRHNLVLLGQPSLLHTLSLNVNKDIKSRITYSATLLPLTDEALEQYVYRELNNVNLGKNTFDEAAIELIIRSADGNLRLCRNLCHGSLIEACRDTMKIVNTGHVNNVLIQPHWRSHEELIKNQGK